VVESSVFARVKRRRLLGCSVAALTAALGGTAYADCLPNPPTTNGTVTCSGATTGGLTVATSATVNVDQGASVTASGGDLAAVLITSTGATYMSPTSTVALNVSGDLDGGSGAGVLVRNETSVLYSNQTTANIVVGADSAVTGSTAIRLDGVAGPNYYGRSFANLDNSGDIRSTSGAALVAASVERAAFLTVTNRAGGYIGGISGTVQTLDNAGIIDGGANSAWSYASGNYAVWGGVLTNSGTIRSSGAAATINPASAPSIVNSGLIINTGTGAAIATPGGITIENRVGGIIQANGVAIDGSNLWGGGFRLTNQGVINGSVLASPYSDGAVVNNVDGVINGDLLFGGSDDTLIATLGSSGLDYGTITGRLDGGGGDNRLRFLVTSDLSIGEAFNSAVLPTNFRRFQAQLSNDAVLTFAGDIPDGLAIGGQGKVVSNGVVSTTGTAFSAYYQYGMSLSFANNGTINAQLQIPPGTGPYLESAYAVSLRSVADFVNNGTINGLGGHGVYVSQSYDTDRFLNTGEITATGYALNLGGSFTNDGLLQSTTSAAVLLDLGGGGARSKISTNNGTIKGVTAGASLSDVTFVNTGTISASDGYGVSSYYSTFDNRAGGVVTGSKGSVSGANGYDAIVRNAGTLNGDVNLASVSPYDTSSDTYIDEGGVLNGSLRLGAGDDYFIAAMDRATDQLFAGVTGTVDAGAGNDTLVLRISKDATTTLSSSPGFENLGLVLSNDAAVKLTANQVLTSTLALGGTGSLDFTGDITSTTGPLIAMNGLKVDPQYGVTSGSFFNNPMKLSVVSRGALSVQPAADHWAQGVTALAGATFENAGTISAFGGTYYGLYAIAGGDKIINSGTITLSSATGVVGATSFVNTGRLVQAADGGKSYGVRGAEEVDNSGTISTGGTAVSFSGWYVNPVTLANSGVITSTAGTAVESNYTSSQIVNTASGVITGGGGTAISGSYYVDTVRNDGVITGAINLGESDDRIENYGSITGEVNLGDGNDTFVQSVKGAMTGTVDGSYGLDTLVIDSTGGGTISTSQFINFESFKQIGDGSLNYVGDFGQGPIVLDGNSAAVKAGDTVTTWGGVAFAGGAGSEHLTVDGSILGGAALGDGVDTVVNHGSIGGSVQLGAGDDTYTEGWNSTVSGVINGASGTDTYIFELAGNRNGLHARSGFENLGVTGLGNLTLALDQDWNSISLAGANAYLIAGSHTVGRLSGGDQDEAVRIDADIAQVDLGGGADDLQVEFTQLAGAYRGGAGIDRIHFTAAAPVTVAGSLSGFETIALDGGQMAVSGVLGSAGETTTFEGQAGQTLSILSGGALAGTVDLGAGDDLFQLAAGGQLAGTVLGGAGSDKVAIDLISDLTLRGDQLQQFETLQVTGTGALNFTGAARFDHLVTDSKDLTLAAGSSLNAGDLSLGGAANTMTVAGAFTGVVDLGGGDDVLRLTTGGTFTGSAQGGAGSDTLELALGGTDAAPTALGSTPFAGFETLSLQSGVVSVSGDYGFDTIQVRNGRLIGLAGSRLAASNIVVAQGATFGSAGAVSGNIAVAGTLSPGASPGTMTVTGNVALASGSTALFELTPTVSDQLVVSGTVTIAQGSTLKLVGAAALTPGRRLDLITAGGGITGAFSTIDGAQGLNLHIAQSATRLQAVGLFTTDTSFSSQVSGVIGALNTALIEDKVGAALAAAIPALVDPATNKSDPRALARVTPQAYASAAQLALEDGLTIVDASRAQARFAPEAPGLFGFGQAIASRRTLDGDAGLGVAKGKIDTNGGLAGVGYGVDSAWAGVFVGYLNGRQRIRDLDARTETDSFAIGVQGQVRLGAFQLGAMAAHDGADVDTRRAAPGGTTATGDYKLKSWIADVNLSYRAQLNADWAVRPRLGASYVRATRDGFVERGGGAFALTVQDDTSSTWFVDGQVEVLGGQAAGARLHPFASLGFRSTADGGDTAASGLLAGLATPISVGGLDRGGTLATAGVGAGYDLAPGLTVSTTYAGEFGDGGRQALLVGLNWKF
jgi:hypothetical protein